MHDRTCSIHGCESRPHARGWCTKHYQRWLSHGDPKKTLVATSDINRLERVLAHTVADGTCLRWQGAVLKASGYARVVVDGKPLQAHRYVHEMAIGPIPEGHEVDHVKARGCKHRDCINPDHLEAVTHAENIYRTDNPLSLNARKTHCLEGHLLAGGNLVPDKDGRRVCRECRMGYRRARFDCEWCGKNLSKPNAAAHRKRCPEAPSSEIGVAQ